MRKGIFLGFCLFCLLLHSVTAQETPVGLNAALQNSASYVMERIPRGSKIVILNFKTDYTQLADYIIDELTTIIVNDGRLKAVDRQNLELIRKEMDFQLSGEVSDESAQSIGKKLGAQTILSGEITQIGDVYRLRVKAISVETAEIQGMQSVTISFDRTLAALTNSKKTPAKTVQGEEWKNKWLYVGAWGGLVSRSYTDYRYFADYTIEESYTNSENEAAFRAQIEVQLAKIFSIKAEAGSGFGLRMGLFGNLTFRPSIMDIDVYAGFVNCYYGTSLGLGGSIGVKLGSGILFVDLCVADTISALGAGYKVGLMDKK